MAQVNKVVESKIKDLNLRNPVGQSGKDSSALSYEDALESGSKKEAKQEERLSEDRNLEKQQNAKNLSKNSAEKNAASQNKSPEKPVVQSKNQSNAPKVSHNQARKQVGASKNEPTSARAKQVNTKPKVSSNLKSSGLGKGAVSTSGSLPPPPPLNAQATSAGKPGQGAGYPTRNLGGDKGTTRSSQSSDPSLGNAPSESSKGGSVKDGGKLVKATGYGSPSWNSSWTSGGYTVSQEEQFYENLKEKQKAKEKHYKQMRETQRVLYLLKTGHIGLALMTLVSSQRKFMQESARMLAEKLNVVQTERANAMMDLAAIPQPRPGDYDFEDQEDSATFGADTTAYDNQIRMANQSIQTSSSVQSELTSMLQAITKDIEAMMEFAKTRLSDEQKHLSYMVKS